MIKKLLVANRGEIAVRIIRAAHSLGVSTVAVCSEADSDALFTRLSTEVVTIGAGLASDSYLNQEALLNAAVGSGADAVHPGYGFLAENAEFAQRVLDAGLIWVGPSPESMRSMGLKIEARRLAKAAGVKVVPGFDESQDVIAMRAAADNLGYPVMVKASAGGGGKGIRIAAGAADFDAALRGAKEESKRAFGDSDMIVERYITRPRHIEVQIIGDSYGSLVHLGTRECSLQRKHQKLVEEAPATNLREEVLQAITEAALALGKSIGYQNAGTVEFVVDADTQEFFFLEVNTRLQVEHPVTEAVTGLDLVVMQLQVASGMPIGIAQSDIHIVGHAFEARINAEDPAQDFFPQTGVIAGVGWPKAGVRVDTGVTNGSTVPVFYDSMLAKLIVHAANREDARRRMVGALGETYVAGVGTNIHFLQWLLNTPEVVANTVTTRMVDALVIPSFSPTQETIGEAADRVLIHLRDGLGDGPWGIGLRLTPHVDTGIVLLGHAGEILEVTPPGLQVSSGFFEHGLVGVRADGRTHVFEVLDQYAHWRSLSSGNVSASSGEVRAPFPGLIASVHVTAGDLVSEGDLLITLEAMKMLHPITATGNGAVAAVQVEQGTTVESNTTLVVFEQEPNKE